MINFIPIFFNYSFTLNYNLSNSITNKIMKKNTFKNHFLKVCLLYWQYLIITTS